jgi:hypothetical protein
MLGHDEVVEFGAKVLSPGRRVVSRTFRHRHLSREDPNGAEESKLQPRSSSPPRMVEPFFNALNEVQMLAPPLYLQLLSSHLAHGRVASVRITSDVAPRSTARWLS